MTSKVAGTKKGSCTIQYCSMCGVRYADEHGRDHCWVVACNYADDMTNAAAGSTEGRKTYTKYKVGRRELEEKA